MQKSIEVMIVANLVRLIETAAEDHREELCSWHHADPANNVEWFLMDGEPELPEQGYFKDLLDAYRAAKDWLGE